MKRNTSALFVFSKAGTLEAYPMMLLFFFFSKGALMTYEHSSVCSMDYVSVCFDSLNLRQSYKMSVFYPIFLHTDICLPFVFCHLLNLAVSFSEFGSLST